MTSTNYIIANIKLLIEISDNGNYKIHEDRTHMDFHPCDDLPPIRKNEDGENIMQNILQMVSSSTNKIKWDADNNDDFVVNNAEEEEDDDEEDDDEEEEDDEDDDEEDEDEEDEKEEDDDEEYPKKEEQKTEEIELPPRVYIHERNNKQKTVSQTTTLKNRVKNNISKKNRII